MVVCTCDLNIHHFAVSIAIKSGQFLVNDMETPPPQKDLFLIFLLKLLRNVLKQMEN